MIKVRLMIEMMRGGKTYFNCPVCSLQHEVTIDDYLDFKNSVISKTVCGKSSEDFFYHCGGFDRGRNR